MSKKKAATKREAVNPQAMHDAVGFLMGIPEIAEAFTRADIELALDDRGWIVPAKGFVSSDMDDQTRMLMVSKSRLYWQRDPLAKQAVRLWTDYGLGDGMTYKAEDDAVQTTLDQFCKDRRNRCIMSSEGQRKSSKKLLIDGEVFFAVFTEADGTKTIRRIDPLQVTDIICDPDDDERVLGYKRETCAATKKTFYYVDWKCDNDDIALFEQQKDRENGSLISAEEDVVVYHHAFDAIDKRGNGLLFCALDWSKEHRRFMEARVAIVQALSKFAWKTTVKGGQAALNKIKNDMQSTYALTGATQTERNPVNAPGGNWLQNSALDMAPSPRTTGGGESKSDGDQLKLMVSAGTGIMLHYFGDPSTGNLATATAMELPMLKMFASYQKFWTDCYRDLFSIVLDDGDQENADDNDSDDEVIDIDLPPILRDDLAALGTFLTSATTMFPELKVPEVLRMLLQSLGVDNLEEVLQAAEAQKKVIDSNIKAGKNADGSPKPVPAAGGGFGKQQEAAELTEALDKLCGLLEWADSSGEDDHGRAGSEAASTPEDHRAAADYHRGQVDRLKQGKNGQPSKHMEKKNYGKISAHADAEAAHRSAASQLVSAKLNPNETNPEWAAHSSEWANKQSGKANSK